MTIGCGQEMLAGKHPQISPPPRHEMKKCFFERDCGARTRGPFPTVIGAHESNIKTCLSSSPSLHISHPPQTHTLSALSFLAVCVLPTPAPPDTATATTNARHLLVVIVTLAFCGGTDQHVMFMQRSSSDPLAATHDHRRRASDSSRSPSMMPSRPPSTLRRHYSCSASSPDPTLIAAAAMAAAAPAAPPMEPPSDDRPTICRANSSATRASMTTLPEPIPVSS